MVIKGSYRQVMNGTADETIGGLRKSDIKTIHKQDGTVKYVSKIKHKQGKKNPWIEASMIARKSLGLEHEFVLMNVGSIGKKFYKLTKKIYEQ
jgi:hypothetical protein